MKNNNYMKKQIYFSPCLLHKVIIKGEIGSLFKYFLSCNKKIGNKLF
ncbi:MAG: hypothetical protein JWO58_1666 [Chitinophagaceae bacterium]|nr:hypothetical protein [Chitinophagaceae bacterium]